MNLFFRLAYLIVSCLLTHKEKNIYATFVRRTRVYPTDIDMFMHMTNSRYLALMDLGRTEILLRTKLADITRSEGWYPVVAGVRINFIRELKPFTKFRLETRLVGWDDKWVYLKQSFHVGSKLCAEAYVKAVFLGKKEGRVSTSRMAELLGEPLTQVKDIAEVTALFAEVGS